MRVATVPEFLLSPVGRWTPGPPVTAWVVSPKLAGTIYTGFASGADVPQMRELAPLPFHPALARPYRAIVDCSGVTGVEPAAYAFLIEHINDIVNVPGLVDAVALVRPVGMTGAVAVGVFYEHVSSLIDVRFVDSLAEAIAHVRGEAHREEIEAVTQEIAQSSLLVSLRRILLEDPRQTLELVARGLGVSTRTLQRACLAADTTYRDEVANARFAFSEQLLRATNEKIDAIARRAGYASAATFARRFQQVHGITPTQFRARR